MDKNTITGLVLMAAIMVTFTMFFNSGEQPKEESSEKDKTEDTTSVPIVDHTPEVDTMRFVPLYDTLENKQLRDSSSSLAFYRDTVTGQDTLLPLLATAPEVGPTAETQSVQNDNEAMKAKYGSLSSYVSMGAEEQLDSLKNDEITVIFSNHGGMPVAVYLNNYRTYKSKYITNDENPLQLFDKEGSKWSYDFEAAGVPMSTGDLRFTKVKNDGEELEYLIAGEQGTIAKISYYIQPGEFHVRQKVDLSGIPNLDPTTVKLSSDVRLLSTEKHVPSERRASTIFYHADDDYDYIREGADDEVEMEHTADWVAFKQSYFSAIVWQDKGFPAEGTELAVTQIESDKYINHYEASLNMGMENGSETAEMTWFFGPNDYDLLSKYDNGSEDIVNLGWGLFRWINVYMIRPLFNLFDGWGLGIGIAIFLLTLVVKTVLIPVTFKMYKSSAKMRALKPEIEEINKKYPDKADAQKRQMETMQLYGQTGVNPLSGCLPMLLQMPILFAVFRFFPSSLDLRQESFLWAEDLSSYDSIASWDTEIWGLSAIYGNHISLFTLLMAGTTLLYTHVNSQNMAQQRQPGMPNMQVMMYIFPVMMIFFFNSYSSGLSYYYFISTLMSILIMFSIKKWGVDDKKLRATIEAKKNSDEPKKKSKFQMRLEELQRQQQEKNKNRKK